MAEFAEVMRQWKRMCMAIGKEDEYTACDKCKLRGFGCPAIYEEECNGADWGHVENVVTKWAAEHPEPVYPTWYEWLTSIGAVTRKVKPDVASELIETGLLDPIPADLAEKLGIEPKEM